MQTYQAEIHSLFAYNETLLISDGVQARVGSLGAGREWFKPWRTITGETLAEKYLPELQVMIQGVFDRRRFLDLLRYFVVFEDFGGGAVVEAQLDGCSPTPHSYDTVRNATPCEQGARFFWPYVD